jgi:hypothetical protein
VKVSNAGSTDGMSGRQVDSPANILDRLKSLEDHSTGKILGIDEWF